MRALLERSKLVGAAIVLMSAGCVLGLVHAAEAGNDPGLRRVTFFPEALLSAFVRQAPAPVPGAEREPVLLVPAVPHHHHPRRIWAAARGRPLRIALGRPRRLAGASRKSLRAAAHPVRIVAPREVFRLVPPPTRTALVSIYHDKTLRTGDAVMLGDGLHVFRDDGFWPHRPRDFVRLQFVAGLDWHLRRTLEPFDNNPPTRWTSIMVPPA